MMQKEIYKTDWLYKKDYPELLEIGERCPDEHVEKGLRIRKQINGFGIAARRDSKIKGFVLGESYENGLELSRFVVSTGSRREGVGSSIVNQLVDLLIDTGRDEIVLMIRKSNSGAWSFLESQRFDFVKVLEGHYEDTGEDAYVMRYELKDNQVNGSFDPRNRITEYWDDK